MVRTRGSSENVRSVVVGMIKQSVLKQLRKGEGVGKGKILYWRERRCNNHFNNRIVLFFLLDILQSSLSYLIKPKHLVLDDNKF